MQRADSLEKTLQLGKIDDRRRRGQQRTSRLGETSPTQWTWVWANSRRQWRTGKCGELQCVGITKSWTQLTDWTISFLCKIRIIEACNILNIKFSSVQLLSHVWPFATLWTAACQASLSFTISWSLVKLKSIKSVMSSSYLVLFHPLLLLPSIFPASGSFQMSVLPIRWPKYWSFSFSISPSNEYSGLISFTIDWWDLLAVQRTLKSLLQHHSSKVLILWCSAFFMVQL